MVVQVLTGTLSSESARRALQDQGADSRYTVAPSSELGYSSPIVQITGVGATPQSAVHTAEVVGDALKRELDRMQAVRGVDPQYEIKTHEVESPPAPSCGHRARLGRWSPCSHSAGSCCSSSSRWPTP